MERRSKSYNLNIVLTLSKDITEHGLKVLQKDTLVLLTRTAWPIYTKENPGYKKYLSNQSKEKKTKSLFIH